MRAWILTSLLLGAVLAGCVQGSDRPEPGSSEAAWRIVDTEGQGHTPSSTAGAPLLVFFMATWCSSCKAATDDLAQVHEAYADEGLQLISVTWDPNEGPEDLEAWKQRYEQPWPHGIDEAFHIHRQFDIRSQSSVIVLDGQGELVQRWGYGQADAQGMSEAVEQALERGA